MSKSTQTNAIPVAIPSFNGTANTFITALTSLDRAAVKAHDRMTIAMQQFLDTCATLGLPRNQANVKRLGTEIRQCEVFLNAVATGMLEKKSVTEYAQSAMRAYFHNVPYSPGLKNDADYKIPDTSGETKGTPVKAGKVTSTTREALDATLCKALQQARLLGLNGFAADILDLCIATLEGFSEKAAD